MINKTERAASCLLENVNKSGIQLRSSNKIKGIINIVNTDLKPNSQSAVRFISPGLKSRRLSRKEQIKLRNTERSVIIKDTLMIQSVQRGEFITRQGLIPPPPDLSLKPENKAVSILAIVQLLTNNIHLNNYVTEENPNLAAGMICPSVDSTLRSVLNYVDSAVTKVFDNVLPWHRAVAAALPNKAEIKAGKLNSTYKPQVKDQQKNNSTIRKNDLFIDKDRSLISIMSENPAVRSAEIDHFIETVGIKFTELQKEQFIENLAGKEFMTLYPPEHQSIANKLQVSNARVKRMSEYQGYMERQRYLSEKCGLQLLDKSGEQVGEIVTEPTSGWTIFINTLEGWANSLKIEITNIGKSLANSDPLCRHYYFTSEKLLALASNVVVPPERAGAFPAVGMNKPSLGISRGSSSSSLNTLSTRLSNSISSIPPLKNLPNPLLKLSSGRQVGIYFETKITTEGDTSLWRLIQRTGHPAKAKKLDQPRLPGKIATFNDKTQMWKIEGVDGEHIFRAVAGPESVKIGDNSYAATYNSGKGTFKLDDQTIAYYSESHEEWRQLPDYRYIRTDVGHSIPVVSENSSPVELDNYWVKHFDSAVDREYQDGIISTVGGNQYVKIDKKFYQVQQSPVDTVIIDPDGRHPPVSIVHEQSVWKKKTLPALMNTKSDTRMINESLLKNRGVSLSEGTATGNLFMSEGKSYIRGEEAYYEVESRNGQFFIKDTTIHLEYSPQGDVWEATSTSFNTFLTLPDSLKITVTETLFPVEGYIGAYRTTSGETYLWSGTSSPTGDKYIRVNVINNREFELILTENTNKRGNLRPLSYVFEKNIWKKQEGLKGGMDTEGKSDPETGESDYDSDSLSSGSSRRNSGSSEGEHEIVLGEGAGGIVHDLENGWVRKTLKGMGAMPGVDDEVRIFKLVYGEESAHKISRTVMTMKKVPGESLQFFDKSTLTLHDKENLIACVQKIHNMGIYHGDLKTTNIFFDQATREWYLIDFGLSEQPAEKIKLDEEMQKVRTMINSW